MYRVIIPFLLVTACQQQARLERKPTAIAATSTPQRVEALALDRALEATGTANPAREAYLSAAVPGRITDIPVELGQRVKKGAALVRLDPYGFSLGVQQAEAGVAAATVQADQANRELTRIQRLVDAKVAPGAKVEQVEAAHKGALAQKQMAEAGLKQAQKALGDSTVRAPFDCTIDMILKEVGEYAPAMPPTMLVKIVDTSWLEVQVHLPESRAGEVEVGMPAQVGIDSAGVETTGEVVFVSNRVQPGTQTFEVRVRIANPDEKIKGGAFARVSFAPPDRKNIVVPNGAIHQGEGDGAFVWVVDDGKARRVAVTVGEKSDRGVVIKEGLARDRPVIVSSLSGLSDGDPVTAEIN